MAQAMATPLTSSLSLISNTSLFKTHNPTSLSFPISTPPKVILFFSNYFHFLLCLFIKGYYAIVSNYCSWPISRIPSVMGELLCNCTTLLFWPFFKNSQDYFFIVFSFSWLLCYCITLFLLTIFKNTQDSIFILFPFSGLLCYCITLLF